MRPGRRCAYCKRQGGCFSHSIGIGGFIRSFYLHLRCVQPMRDEMARLEKRFENAPEQLTAEVRRLQDKP